LPTILVFFSTLTFTWEEEEEEEREEEERKEQDQDLYFHLKRTTWFRVTSLDADFSWPSQLCERPFQRRC
jgi:hypothetical protein